ncbi:MAG: 4Fe-4S binding protein [Myxococcaceae bacterium]
MSALHVDHARCVHARSVKASCRACVEACPTSAITLAGERQAVHVDLESCTTCGLCVAACPTEVFDVGRQALPEGTELKCGGPLPCVGALSVEDLVQLGLSGPRTIIAAAGCIHGRTGHRAERIAEANAVLSALGARHTLTWREEGPPGPPFVKPPKEAVPPRRQFFRMLTPKVDSGPTAITPPDKLDPARVRAQLVPERRKRTLAAIPSGAAPKVATLPDSSFTSTKRIDLATCTGCMACVTACPTGALTTNRTREVVRFDGGRCVKCHLCHDVCEPAAITLAPAFELEPFLDAAPRTLVTLPMRPCAECGLPYKADGQPLCPTCRAQDAEARELQRLT